MRSRSSRLRRRREVRLEPVQQRTGRIERVAERGDRARSCPRRSCSTSRATRMPNVRVRPEMATGAPPDRKWAVSVRHSSSTSVFTRCSGITIARARLSSFATSLNSTRPAPSSASVTMKTSDAQRPPRLAGWPAATVRQTQTASTMTSTRARPLESRCENSTSISAVGRARHDLSVAQRPVGAAAGAGPGGAHVGAPEDDDDVPGEHEPGEARRVWCARGDSTPGGRDSGRGIRPYAVTR